MHAVGGGFGGVFTTIVTAAGTSVAQFSEIAPLPGPSFGSSGLSVVISNEADPPGGIPVSLRPPMMGDGNGLLVPICQPAGTAPNSVA